jgi:quercetin dioxygenase-like cupin family protein
VGAQTTNERSRGLPLAGEVTRWPFTGKGMLAYSPSIVALRHWHWLEDEFVMVLEGEATLVTEAEEKVLGLGMVAGFPKGKADGHHLVNRGSRDVVCAVPSAF